jgi:aryl carrier-like protein
MVTKLLSRAEMLSDPLALEAVKAEADGLIKAGTWSLDSVREKEDVRAEAKRTGVSVDFGQLMTIACFHQVLRTRTTSSEDES